MEPPVRMYPTEWEGKIQNIEESGIALSQWEAEFVDSLSKQISEGAVLTFRQSKKLREIHGRVE